MQDTQAAPAAVTAPPGAGMRELATRWQARAATFHPTTRALMWTVVAGFTFSHLNALMRALTLQLDPMQSQFLRYLFGFLVLLPLFWKHGLAAYRPKSIWGQFTRGGVHTVGLILWFLALPRIPLADMTAIGFTGPIFIMLGAWLVFKEPMRWERWAAAIVGFVGVMVVVGPRLTGHGGVWNLVMLASAPCFAASFLLTKALTRTESTGVIVVWQALTVTLLSLPLALPVWQPVSPAQWAGFALCGLLGSFAHFALTRAYRIADISATQSVKFLDLVWATLLGWLVFGDAPSFATIVGGSIICASTIWIAHREARQRLA